MSSLTGEQQRPVRQTLAALSKDDWYAPPPVVNGRSVDAVMEWNELLEARHAAEMQLDAPATIAPERLHAAVENGVPDALRPQIWLRFSGAERRIRESPNLYAEIQQRISMGGVPGFASAAEQIEKDLRRTDLSSDDSAALDALRRVLAACACFDAKTSYVQGMNFIASGLLHVLPEEGAFWMLVLVVQRWLPDHFIESMSGNNVDCAVLDELVAEQTPKLHAKLAALQVGTQLLTARWFLCLFSSVVSPSALLRLWDLLFVCGPQSTFHAALGCMRVLESRLLCSSDMGTALALARDGLWRCADAQSVEALLRGCVACARACVLGAAELSSRRQRARVRLLVEAQRLEAARVLLRVQRASGLAVADVRALAALSLGDDGVLRAADLDVGWIQIGVQRDAFAQIVAALVPHWSAHSPLLPLLFEVFRTRVVMPGLPSDAAAEADAQRDETRDDAPVLSFLRLVSGLGWLLRGSSARRAELCFHCFDREGCGAVTRADFIAVLCYIYALYEDLGASPLRNAHAHATRVAERIQAEATRFVDMMFELWDEEGVGLLSRARFDRAAHQHPLLVQTFQLEQLDSPQVRQPLSAAPAAPTQPQTTSSTRVTSAADRTPKACVKSRTTTTSSSSAAIVQSPLLKIRDDYFSEDVRRL